MSAPSRGWHRDAATLLIFTLLALAFTWPLATDPLRLHLSRQFDMYSLIWLEAAAPGLDSALHTDASGWPYGESLLRADSYILLVMARVLAPIFDPRLAGTLCTLFGPVLSAWAAERFAANHLGARWPWSLIAGVAYGFSGLVATALLEGHVYAMFNPWLPLLAGHFSVATSREGTAKHGLLAGVWWALALLSTAYIGIAASILVAALFLRGLAGRTLTLRPLAGALAIAVPVAVIYVAVFAAGGEAVRDESGIYAGSPFVVMGAGSARLATLAGWTWRVDVLMHSIAPVLGFTALSLMAFAPVVLRTERGWKFWAWLAVGGVVISLGPVLQAYNFDLGLPWVLWPVAWLGEQATFFHHPARMLWLTGLGMGAVAARTATVLARRSPLFAAPLLVAAVIDALVGTGAPLRVARVPLEVPSAYRSAPPGQAVLELLPKFHGTVADMEMYANNLTCAYQLFHGRPLPNICIGTKLHHGPRWVVGSWLGAALLADSADATHQSTLADLGFGAVAVHPDLFTDVDRARVLHGLSELLGPPAADSRDGGERVVLFTVPNAANGDMVSRRARYAELEAIYR